MHEKMRRENGIGVCYLHKWSVTETPSGMYWYREVEKQGGVYRGALMFFVHPFHLSIHGVAFSHPSPRQ